jgi:dihydroneopterin aldolase
LLEYRNRKHIDLLETILAEVLNFCFRNDKVVAAEVRLTKPDVFSGFGTPAVSAAVSRESWLLQNQ